ncbi:MAG: response regulator [Microcoleaceae cyanobacterium MO_207.B10]|nr:response regulator [Microcoleaceae cyanobacterium MO_207.B10]
MSTVLVVDDQLSHREMIANLLIKNGFKVISASNGVKALEKIKIQKPDLVILDIVMPEMNGYEVCRRVKSNPQTKDLPVIFCSIKGEEFDRYWGMKSAADAYIVKPFHPQEFIDTVKQLLP